MVVRARASGNISYAGTLNIIGNNSPLATLDGVASGFAGCNAGGQGPGGFYLACGVSGSYNLVVTPSNCMGGNTNPVCNGGNGDASGLSFSPGIDLTTFTSSCCGSGVGSGHSNTPTLMGYSGGVASFPAASYCSGLVYGGFDDWFLPSIDEMTGYFYPLRNTVGWSVGANYITSSVQNPPAGYWFYLQGSNGSSQAVYGTNNGAVTRCMRRDPPAPANPIVDATPLSVLLNASYGGPSETRTSNSVTIYGVTQPITVSVSGGTSPQYSINGGAYTSAAGTATNGDQVTLRVTSPALGQESVVTITTGSITTNWLIRTPGNNLIRIFTTPIAYNGNLGGMSGADTICTSTANTAGLPGNWIAVMAGGNTGDLINTRLPWNWKTLKNMSNNTVAVSVDDFMDGSILAPMNLTPTGAIASGSLVWTGVYTTGISTVCANWGCGSTQISCNGWTSAVGSGMVGDSASTNVGSYFATGIVEGLCSNTSYRLLCMETNQAGADTDPNAVSIQPQVRFASGGTGSSNTVTVTGVTDEIPVTIVPSAGTANIIKDGVSVGATTTMAGLNATLSFTLTAPTVLGTRNTATITLGPDTYTWWVGYADAAREAKIFNLWVPSNGIGGGLSNVDGLCRTEAASSPLGLSSSWKALLSDSSTNAADRISWNWRSLKTVSGDIVVDGGFPDLWDGTLDGPINKAADGSFRVVTNVYTGTLSSGMKAGAVSADFCYDWTSSAYDSVSYGNSGITSSGWVNSSSYQCNQHSYVYCVEDVESSGADATPNNISIQYPVQVPTSSRQSSSPVLIGGMSTGAAATLSVTATGGTPTFKVNGGAELTSASVINGDSVVFLMNAPATGNSSNKMTIRANGGASIVGYWRVWTGDTTGAVVKRVFAHDYGYGALSTNQGSILAVDALCQNLAVSAGLGGTWKVIASGEGTDENNWAVNRIGYNWSVLKRTDGVDVVLAGNLWSTNVVPLLAPIAIGANGSLVSTSRVATGSTKDGLPVVGTINGQCNGFTQASTGTNSVYGLYRGTSGSTGTSWIQNGMQADYGCHPYELNAIYCIQQ